MSNFRFLSTEWQEIGEAATKAESLAHADPRTSCFYSRRSLELAVEWLYRHDSSLTIPYERNLSAMLHEPSFRAQLPPELFLKTRIIKDLGNQAAHSKKQIRQFDAIQVTRELFHFLYWLARTYSRTAAVQLQGLTFDSNLLKPTKAAEPHQTLPQLQKLETDLKERDEKLAAQAKVQAETDAQISQLKKEIAEAKQRNQKVPDTHDYSEAQTRDFFIDLLLREAGWKLDRKEDREFPVKGMPTDKGDGYADYVLWGNDGLPLAVVEAKRTKKDPRIGQQQAKLYADCLEKMFGLRPLIFYTNGYKTWLWDDQMYPPREVSGFFTKDELELRIQRRKDRKSIAAAAINKEIVDRYYQEESIRAVTENFEAKQRKELVVMATGAGKTRTVVALCELLQRCNWAKRILFLADRVALVRQAVNAFKRFLPESSPVNLVTEKNTDCRVFVSTYPTMMTLIDEMQGETRRFGPGYFDLIIIDEAHRSVYQKYRHIFEYFDCLLVGLTATPKDEVDKNTYSLFELETGVPTYAYELSQAVGDHFLVPPQPISVPLKFQREGIRYDQLSPEEKAQWEELDWEEDGVPDRVEAEAINKWLFNADTVDKVLEHLMLNGQKVCSGDRLGKTIIFAKNHQHALFIQERFDKNYPHYKGKFASVIDNYNPYAQSAIDEFSIAANEPHIAISVDMLDTGIDVPEVVNLVFFKLIRSKTKFFQMLGRGTRSSPNLFGPGKHKEFFYVFDYCQNLEFFNQNPKGIEAPSQQSLGKKLFLRRLQLSEELGKESSMSLRESTANPIAILRREVGEILFGEVKAMNVGNFIVRKHREHVERFQEKKSWQSLTQQDYENLARNVAGLPSELPADDETAKQFDLLLLNLQLAVLNSEPKVAAYQETIRRIAGQLELKGSIPMVAKQMPLILDIQTDEFWENITLPILENVRKRLRDLVQFIDKARQTILKTDFEDQIGLGTVMTIPGIYGSDLAQYRKKVMHFLMEHEDHIALKKLRNNQPFTPTDLKELERLLFEIGKLNQAQLESLNTAHDQLGVFIRKLVGLDREAAKDAFGQFLQHVTLTANQLRFINLIIDHLTTNGIMDPALLYEAPYTDLSTNGLDGVFGDGEAGTIVGILKTIKENAAA